MNNNSTTLKNGSTTSINFSNKRVFCNVKKKKIENENNSYTDDLRDVFPKYYHKSFLPVKKGNSRDFVFFKYSTNNDNEKEDLESKGQSSSSFSEELESKDLLLKEIKLLFENGYFYTDIEKIFQKFYKDNKSKINFLYTQVLDERFKRPNFGSPKGH
jgi:hypothetical protein